MFRYRGNYNKYRVSSCSSARDLNPPLDVRDKNRINLNIVLHGDEEQEYDPVAVESSEIIAVIRISLSNLQFYYPLSLSATFRNQLTPRKPVLGKQLPLDRPRRGPLK